MIHCKRKAEALSTATASTPPSTDQRCTASMPWATSMTTAIAPATEVSARAHGSSPRRAAANATPGAASRKKSASGPRSGSGVRERENETRASRDDARPREQLKAVR